MSWLIWLVTPTFIDLYCKFKLFIFGTLIAYCLQMTTKVQITLRGPVVAQSVTCLATDACLTADPGVVSSILARYHTFVEIMK